ncbi:hypothetical protein [Microbacterium sp.]|uniref:hypothetical protein n=1 Tax=Microbacterium sp. TaxID=51671 RepID=UPI002615A9DA|nr:hypothetical protein [Microbacterium sp.]
MLDDELRNAIRELLGVDETLVPDALIDSPLIGQRIEAQVLAEIGPPDFLLRPIAEQEAIRRIIAHRIAAALLGTGTLRDEMSVTQERFGQQYTVTRASNLTEWAAELEAIAASELAKLTQTGTLHHFMLARGRRGA